VIRYVFPTGHELDLRPTPILGIEMPSRDARRRFVDILGFRGQPRAHIFQDQRLDGRAITYIRGMTTIVRTPPVFLPRRPILASFVSGCELRGELSDLREIMNVLEKQGDDLVPWLKEPPENMESLPARFFALLFARLTRPLYLIIDNPLHGLNDGERGRVEILLLWLISEVPHTVILVDSPEQRPRSLSGIPWMSVLPTDVGLAAA